MGICSENVQKGTETVRKRKQKFSTSVRFELTRGNPNGLAGRRGFSFFLVQAIIARSVRGYTM